MLPVTSFGVSTHRGHLKGWCQMHPFVIVLLLISATEEPCDWSRLLGLPVTVHQPHRLPVEIVLTFHREQSVDPLRWWWVLPCPFNIANHTHQHKHHQNPNFPHPNSISGSETKWVFPQRSEFHLMTLISLTPRWARKAGVKIRSFDKQL